MDGMHDLGGKEGFGPVRRDGKKSPFEFEWELTAHAMGAAMVGAGVWNMDEQRHAIERMEPKHYMVARYYERHLVAATTLFIEKGLATREDLSAAAGGDVMMALPSTHGRQGTVDEALFNVGDRVRVKAEFVSGHTRFPGYTRGKVGRIVSRSAVCHFPDASGHNLECPMQMTYDIGFEAKDLWPDASDDAEIFFAAFHSYLERVEG